MLIDFVSAFFYSYLGAVLQLNLYKCCIFAVLTWPNHLKAVAAHALPISTSEIPVPPLSYFTQVMSHSEHTSNVAIDDGQNADSEIHGDAYVGQHPKPGQGDSLLATIPV